MRACLAHRPHRPISHNPSAGSHRSRPQARAGAYGRGAYGAYTGSYGGSYGAAGSRAGAGFDPNYNPFQSYYWQGTGGSYWGWKQYARRGGSGLGEGLGGLWQVFSAWRGQQCEPGILCAAPQAGRRMHPPLPEQSPWERRLARTNWPASVASPPRLHLCCPRHNRPSPLPSFPQSTVSPPISPARSQQTLPACCAPLLAWAAPTPPP